MSNAKTFLENSSEVKRYLTGILARLERNEITERKAKALTSIACSIQNSIYGELKEKELAQAEELAEQIKKASGGK